MLPFLYKRKWQETRVSQWNLYISYTQHSSCNKPIKWFLPAPREFFTSYARMSLDAGFFLAYTPPLRLQAFPHLPNSMSALIYYNVSLRVFIEFTRMRSLKVIYRSLNLFSTESILLYVHICTFLWRNFICECVYFFNVKLVS